ncbi:MAG: tetratricopeptide repeat protein [Pirellulaceae bacterium]
MHRGKVVLKWIVCMILLAVSLFVVYMALEVTVISEYRHKHGLIYGGAVHNYIQAMNRGDSTDAIRWAQQMIDLTSGDYPIPERRLTSYEFLARAYEMAGQYEQSLQVHDQYPHWPRDKGTVYYKLGDKKKAFEAFCEFALLEKRQLKLTLPLDMQYARVRTFRDRATGGFFPFEKALWPFTDYTQFYDFMNGRWKETDNHEDYREAMEFLEAMTGKPNSNTKP